MINLTADNFDKAFWLSSTNIRNLMKAAIDIDINVGTLENNMSNIQDQVDNIGNSGSDNSQDLLELMDLLDKHIENQKTINENFFALFQDLTKIVVDHEERLQNGGL